MQVQELYGELKQIAAALYENQRDGMEQFQAELEKLMEFFQIMIEQMPEKTYQLQQCITQLKEGAAYMDKLLLADTLCCEICGLIREYGAANHQQLGGNAEEDVRNIEEEDQIKDYFVLNYQGIQKQTDIVTKELLSYCQMFDTEEPEAAVDAYGNMAVYRQEHWWRLNSFYDSNSAAKSAARHFQDSGYHRFLLLYGLGNMEAVKEIIKTVPFDTVIMIYEPDPKIFAMNMHYRDMSCIWERPLTLLYVKDLNENRIEGGIARYYNEEVIQQAQEWILPNYDVLYYDEIVSKKEYINDMIRTKICLYNTRCKMGMVACDNRIQNLALLAESIYLKDLKLCFERELDLETVPIIIVGAGPSLDGNIEYLKEAKGKAFILAVDSAVRMLNEHHIWPDAVITNDPLKQDILFQNELMEQTPIFYAIESKYNAIKLLQGRKILYNNNAANLKLLDDLYGEPILVKAYGSVTNVALGIAEYIGFHTMIVIGADLAFRDGKKHASVVYDDGGINEWEAAMYTYVEGQNGEQLLTYKNFVYYKTQIEKLLREAEYPIRFINATEGGVNIEGSENMTLKQAVSMFCKKEADIGALIEECGVVVDVERSEQFQSYVEGLKEECGELKADFRTCSKLYEEILKNSNQDTILAKLEKINRIQEKSSKSFVMSLVSGYSANELRKSGNNMEQGKDNGSVYEYIRNIAKEGIQNTQIHMKNIERVNDMLGTCLETMQQRGKQVCKI